MRDLKKFVSLAIFALLMASCPAVFAQDTGVDQIIFPHDLHHDEEIECATCHEGAWESTRIAERFLPEMDVCSDCHETDDDDTCTMCHTSPDDAGDRAAGSYGAQIFSHAVHLTQEFECSVCHGEPSLERPLIPAKVDCRSCHTTADSYTDCRMCHADPAQPVPVSHQSDWIHGHGLPAQMDPDRCFLCHTETGCDECHSGDNIRPRSHGLNFVFGHAIEARGNEMDCAVCHEDPQYCSACHQAERVLPRSHSRADWTNASDGGRHALDAPFEMEQCIACHDTGSESPTCARCHGG